MESISFTITTRTPLVTGDAEKANSEIITTGLRGSLRYQYWLLKAIEAWPENPRNAYYPWYSYDQGISRENLKDDLRRAGPVVRLFGATGWKSLFKIEIGVLDKKGRQPVSARPGNKIAPRMWKFKLTFSLDRDLGVLDKDLEDLELAPDSLKAEINRLMGFVHYYGWLGAAPQNGLGWVAVRPENSREPLTAPAIPARCPVFAARDIEISASQFKVYLETLTEYYRKKEEHAARNKRIRYQHSLQLLTHDPPPIGYEIRRHLKDMSDENAVFGRGGFASHIQISNPVRQKNGTYFLRVRFCNRPNGNGLARQKAFNLKEIEKSISGK